MASRSCTAELAAFLKRFARRTDPGMRAWITALRTGSERTLFGAWISCIDGAPMLLVLGADLREEEGSEAHRRLVLAACACARLALVHVPSNEPRSRDVIEIVERWARGDPSADLVEAERIAAAAPDATWAARDAARAALYTAWAAQTAGWAAARAGWAAWYVAQAARSAALARGASEAEAEAEAACRSALAQCADLVRGFYPRPPYRDPITGAEDEATYWLEIVDDPSIDPAARQAAGVRVLEIEAEIQGA